MLKWLGKIIRFLITILIFILVIASLAVGYVQLRYADRLYEDVAKVPEREFAIVLGAGVLANGKPSQVLQDRIVTAVSLYKGRKVQKLLLTGDGVSDNNYDEAAIMKAQAIRQGVRAKDIFTDTKGTRTIKSCERASQFFEIDSAIVVTQAFHLRRALYLCNSMGIDAVGVEADKNEYAQIRNYQLREIPASLSALWEVNVGTFSTLRIELFQRMFAGFL